MTTREKIIVGAMCLTIFYGVYDLLVSNTSEKTAPTHAANAIGELKLFVAEIGQKLNNERITRENRYMIDQAGAAWDKDPFINSTKPLQKRLASNIVDQQSLSIETHPNFIYSGFMQLGAVRMAIINGMEYAVGESLADKTYYVKSISPQRVVIGMVKSPVTIQLPISEFDTGPGE